MSCFLQDLDLGKYHESLVDEGFDSMERCANAEFEDLLAVGMKRGHARQLLAALSKRGGSCASLDDEKENGRKKPSVDSVDKSRDTLKRYSNGVLEMSELVQASAGAEAKKTLVLLAPPPPSSLPTPPL